MTARLRKLIVQSLFTAESGVSTVTSQGHRAGSLEGQRVLLPCGHLASKRSNSDYRPMLINQLQSVKFV